jgi:hypothetical protein
MEYEMHFGACQVIAKYLPKVEAPLEVRREWNKIYSALRAMPEYYKDDKGNEWWGGDLECPDPNGPGYLFRQDEEGNPINKGMVDIPSELVRSAIWEHIFKPALENCTGEFEVLIKQWCEPLGLSELVEEHVSAG